MSLSKLEEGGGNGFLNRCRASRPPEHPLELQSEGGSQRRLDRFRASIEYNSKAGRSLLYPPSRSRS